MPKSAAQICYLFVTKLFKNSVDNVIGYWYSLRIERKLGNRMPKYNVEMTVAFAGEVEADSQHDAEQIAYSAWGDTSSALIQYDSVEDVNAELIEEDDEEEETV